MASLSQGLRAALEHRYSFGRELGSGGMATVYLARDVQTGHDVAVKVLKPDLLPALGAERFAREVRITSSLQHPHLLPLLDSGQVDGLPFYVTPYIRGESLAQRLRREGSLRIADALDITTTIADVLEFVHDEGFVHRDVKPSNILLADGGAILADFGIARAMDVVTGDRLTESGVVLGTPAYMSPEQAGCGRVDGRSDLYSLGCVLFEMLAGEPPFGGPTAQSVRARHALDPVPSIRTVRATVHPALEHAVHKVMAKIPADRYATAAQFREALASIDRETVITGQTAPGGRTRALGPLGALAAVAGVLVLGWGLSRARGDDLEQHRVMVYPLVAPTQGPGEGGRIGEDVATMIGTALDGVGPLRWIDGWPLLDSTRRNDIRSLSLGQARDLARSRRCAYFLTGRLVKRGDSADVYLELNAVGGDSIIARAKASGPATDAWRTGLHAVNQILPRLIPGDPFDIPAEWNDRDPAAIASYLLGESEFRRLHLAEALSHYRTAVQKDSSFGLAAIRGAQAATWNHQPDQAAALVQRALSQRMPARYLHFALGYQAYLLGLADSAAAEFRRALALDREMTVAWLQLGETYTHLLPAMGNPDSLAEAAFERAHQLDSGANGLLLHLIETRLRQGDTARSAPLIHDFFATGPDTTLAAQIRFMESCVSRGPGAMQWRESARRQGLALLSAGNSLKGGGAQLPCAISAFSAVIEGDTTAAGELRWFALLQLQSALLAQGRPREAIAWIDAPIMHGEGASIYLLDSPLYAEVVDRARVVAESYRQQCGQGYRRCSNPVRLWQMGIWETLEGRIDVAEALATEIGRRSPRSDMPRERYTLPVMARSVAAHAALARGDTAAAVNLFQALLEAPMPGEYLTWDVASPRGLDRLRLAQVLVARGEFQQAIEVASVFESAWPSVYMLYLPASLKVRAEAAERLGDRALAATYQRRLDGLLAARRVAALQ